jgi:hypothetical protein
MDETVPILFIKLFSHRGSETDTHRCPVPEPEPEPHPGDAARGPILFKFCPPKLGYRSWVPKPVSEAGLPEPGRRGARAALNSFIKVLTTGTECVK